MLKLEKDRILDDDKVLAEWTGRVWEYHGEGAKMSTQDWKKAFAEAGITAEQVRRRDS